MMFIKPLPSWVLINRFPAFYESESLTAVEQTARLYAKMRELVESYNKYVEQINTELMEFEEHHDQDYNCLVKTVIKLTSDYISTVDLKLIRMDRTLTENYKMFTDNVLETCKAMVDELKENGELDAALLDAVDNLNAKFKALTTAMNEHIAHLEDQYAGQVAEMQEQYSGQVAALGEAYTNNVNAIRNEVNVQFTQLSDELRTNNDHNTAFRNAVGYELFSSDEPVTAYSMVGKKIVALTDYSTVQVTAGSTLFAGLCTIVPKDDGTYVLSGVLTSHQGNRTYVSDEEVPTCYLNLLGVTMYISADEYITDCEIAGLRISHTGDVSPLEKGITSIVGVVARSVGL